MTGERPVRRVDERRKEAAALFYFNRLRRRRAPLAAAAGCRSSTRPQLQAKTPTPNETNRGDGNQGLAMIESLVESAFSADTRLGAFLRSVTSKETAAWDVVPGKLGVFPCAPPVFPTPATTTRQARRAPRRVRLRAVERQLTGMISFVISGIGATEDSARFLQDGKHTDYLAEGGRGVSRRSGARLRP